ncbi:MAG: hypothetical protein FJ291_21245 [Planctomycetes bacterium]|nr:hypothetical protein [Planctomycetota bacterium]
MTTRQRAAVARLFAVAWAVAGEEGLGSIAERAGGLLPCEEVPGDAVTRKRPDPLLVPRADGGATALFFHTPAIRSPRPMQVVFFDLATGKSRVEEFPGLSDPWSQAWGADGRLYFGLWGPAAVYRYNPATDRIEPFPKMDSCGMVVEGRPGELLLATNRRPGGGAGSTLYAVDLKTRAVTRSVEFPGTLATPREYFGHIDFIKGPDGQVYTLYDDLLVRINPETLGVTALSKVGHTGHIAFVGRDIYLAGLSHFRRVRRAGAP